MRVPILAILAMLLPLPCFASFQVNWGLNNFVRWHVSVYRTNGYTTAFSSSSGGSTNLVYSAWSLPDDKRYMGYAQISAWGGNTARTSNNPILFQVQDLNTPPLNNLFTWNTNGTLSQGTNVIQQGWPGPPVNNFTNQFEWFFDSSWVGANVSVVDTNGQTIGQWVLPNVIGPEGFTLSASIVTNSILSGAEVYINGYPVATLSQAATLTNVERGGLNVFVGPTYAGTNWSVTNSTGRVLTNGNDFSSVDNISLPMFQGQTGYLNVGGQPTTATIQPGNTNYQTFYQPPTTAPQPTPVPTPLPITNDPTVTYPTPDTNGNVSFDPESWDYTFDPSSVLNAGASTLEQIKGATDNFSTGLANINQALDYMSGAIPSGSATSQCVFQFGTVTIDLSGFTTWRTPLKMFVLAAFVMAAIGIIRWSLETY